MDDDRTNRLSPEDLLRVVKREESQTNKGKLKIFLGMAAGVGKTYAMLEEAQILKKNGVDVVIGLIDTHGRAETHLLQAGLPLIPPKKVEYKDKTFEELDLDGILLRQPQLILVDELAHSNVPGVRHLKRWEDVIEILDNGIDVFTTLNIQHIESLKDIVESLAEVPIRETVPDLLFTPTASIQLVDITPDELLVRLREGKVYLGVQSQIAARNFFQKERLTALREIALRYVAEIVNNDLRGMFPAEGSFNRDWQYREKLLVAISHHRHSQQLIRTARHLAFNLDLPWIALHVDDNHSLSETESISLAKNIALARDLGGEFITTSDPDIANGIKRIARQQRVNLIIIGRPRKALLFSQKYALYERLTNECKDIDIFVIKEDSFANALELSTPLGLLTKASGYPYLSITILTALLIGLKWLMLPYVGYKIEGLCFLVCILLFSLWFTKGPLFLSALLLAAFWWAFFVPSTEILMPSNFEDIAIPILFLFTAGIAGILVDRARAQREVLERREKSIQALYEIVNHILQSASLKDAIMSVEITLEKTIEGSCEIIIKGVNDKAMSQGLSELITEEKEINAALWVLENGKEAGISTSTLPLCKNYYAPINGFRSPMGFIAYRPKAPKTLTTEEKNFINTVCQQLSHYVDRQLAEKHRQFVKNTPAAT